MENPFEALSAQLEEATRKIDQLIQSTKNEDGLDKDEFILIDEAASRMGLAKSTMYAYARTRKIRHYKRNANLYFSKTDINEYIRKGAIEAKNSLKIN